MQLLLFSNSTNTGEVYLQYTLPYISEFAKGKISNAVFIPYAGISVGFDTYADMVAEKFSNIGIAIESIHRASNKKQKLSEAQAIVVGGGNTFYLLKMLQENELLPIIQERVRSGVPYIGWSAGSNMACPTIMTTNDMPIVEPLNFNALNLISFQINPHFSDYVQPGHAGETRQMRIEEFLLANKNMYVAGLREGTMLHLANDTLKLRGEKSCKVFHHGKEPSEVNSGDNLDFLMQ